MALLYDHWVATLASKMLFDSPLALKMGRFGNLLVSLFAKNCGRGSLLRTHDLLCFNAKTSNLSHLWAMWKLAV